MYVNLRLLSLSLVVILIAVSLLFAKKRLVRSNASFRMLLYTALVAGFFGVIVSFVPRP